MNKITRFSVEHPVTVSMFVLAVVLLGVISFQKLGMDLFPDLNNPRLYIELEAGERPPEEIEKQFVENIESLSIQQKKAIQVSSVSKAGAAEIIVEYAWDTNMDEAFLDLQKTLSSSFQNADIDNLTISQHDPNAAPIIMLGFSHPEITDMDELRRVAESYLRNELVRMEGIADVRLLGEEEKEVVVETNNYLMEAFNVNPETISSRIQEYNQNVSGGSIVEMGLQYIIKGIGEFESIEDIQNIILTYTSPTTATGTATTTSPGGKAPVYLKDVADIYLKNKKPDNIVRINGKRCIALAIYKETKYNTVKTVDEFFNNLETLRKALPGYNLTIIQNRGEFITSAINEVKQSALIGILFAVMVLFVFLRRLSATFIISLAIPISIIATFNLMYFKGLTLNIMTLGGLALGAGMLVDNAIVVMENIFRNHESGLSIREAAITGTSQVAGAITASTATTVVVFLPIVYLHGTAGELFKEQAWTVSFSLLSSLVVAILVIPMLSSQFLKNKTSTVPEKRSIRFTPYRRFLARILKRRWLIIPFAAAAIVLAARLIPVIGSEFLPRTDLNDYSLDLRLPEGTELYRTENVVRRIESDIDEVFGEHIKTMYSIVGPSDNIVNQAGSVLLDENTATIKLMLNEDSAISFENVSLAVNTILAEIPDIEAQFSQEQTALEMSIGRESAPIVIVIRGKDLDMIKDIADQAKGKLAALDFLYNIETGFERGRPEVDIILDRARSGLYNIGISQLSAQLTTQLAGTQAGQWESDGELRDITVELPPMQLSQLEYILIESGEQKIPLYDIAEIRVSEAPKEIIRKNQSRVGEITADIRKNIPLDHVVDAIRQEMSQISFPPEYSYEIAGEEQKRQESFQNLKFALILSLVLVYMVLASQFESLIHPFTIILSIPLAGVGAILIFFLMGKPLNIMAYIGMIMLAGIAVNDSIVLVDAINKLKNEGFTVTDAIIEAGGRRIRPIIMTSITTILALLPLTFGFGEGAALRTPLALAVIGGLITSTILTLVVIPCVYSVLEGVRVSIRSIGGGTQ